MILAWLHFVWSLPIIIANVTALRPLGKFVVSVGSEAERRLVQCPFLSNLSKWKGLVIKYAHANGQTVCAAQISLTWLKEIWRPLSLTKNRWSQSNCWTKMQNASRFVGWFQYWDLEIAQYVAFVIRCLHRDFFCEPVKTVQTTLVWVSAFSQRAFWVI